MFSSKSSHDSPGFGMELHPLSSKQVAPSSGARDEEQGAFVSGENLLEEEDEEMATRYHRVDSIDEFGSERIGLMPVERGIGRPILPDNNLDLFFREMYEYYLRKGFGSIVSTAITNLTSILFTIIITTVLLTMFDWHKLAMCRDDESTCESFSNYIDSPFNPNRTSFVHSCLLFGSGVAMMGWFWVFSGLFFTINSALKYRSIYRVNNVTTRDLQTMQWSRIVSKLKDWQNQVYYVKNDMQVNAFTIALRILRKENYKIALFCMNILPLGSPDWQTTFAWVPNTKKYEQMKNKSVVRPRVGELRETDIWWMGNALETNLDIALFNQIIDEKTFQVRKGLTGRALRMHLQVLAVLNLIFLPLIFLATFIYFFFRYAEELHSKRNYLGPRWWTPHALWILREFNELPHVFQRRLNGSLRLSEKYLRMFPSPVPIVLARGAAFILGGLVAILLVFGLVDDAVLLRVTLFHRNLVWYAAILSSALAAARALIPPPEEESPGNPNIIMRRISAFTHLLPDHWRGKAHTYDVKEQFEALFPFRVSLLARELLCVLCTPYILGIILPRYADDVVKFIKDYSSSYPGVGDVCTFSLMNLQQHGDPKWNKLLKAIPFRAMGAGDDEDEEDGVVVLDGQDDVHHTGSAATATTSAAATGGLISGSNGGVRRRGRMDLLIDSKLEKSWISFKIQYSAENCGIRDALGEDLLRRVKDFRQSKKLAMGEESAQQQYEQSQNAAMLMSSSMSGLDMFSMVPPTVDWEEEEMLAGAGEEIFWFLELFRDEEMRKRTVGL